MRRKARHIPPVFSTQRHWPTDVASGVGVSSSGDADPPPARSDNLKRVRCLHPVPYGPSSETGTIEIQQGSQHPATPSSLAGIFSHSQFDQVASPAQGRKTNLGPFKNTAQPPLISSNAISGRSTLSSDWRRCGLFSTRLMRARMA